MRATFRLLQHASRITLFTRPNCSLCEDAKGVLSRVWDTRPFEYREIDVMEPGNETWKNNYEFDVPVIHVEQNSAAVMSGLQKLMHRFDEDQVHFTMTRVERSK